MTCLPQLRSGCWTLGVLAERGGRGAGAVAVSLRPRLSPAARVGLGGSPSPDTRPASTPGVPSGSPAGTEQRWRPRSDWGPRGRRAGGGALRPGRLAPPCDVHVRTPVRDDHAGRRSRGAARTRLDRELGALPGGGWSPARGSCLPAAPGSFAVSQPQPRPRLQQTPVDRAAPQPGGCGSPGAEMGPGP